MRLLAVMSAERLKDFDKAPTFRERGIDLQMGTWRALAAPKGTPQPIVDALRRAVDQIGQDKTYREFFARQRLLQHEADGLVVVNDPDGFHALPCVLFRSIVAACFSLRTTLLATRLGIRAAE